MPWTRDYKTSGKDRIANIEDGIDQGRSLDDIYKTGLGYQAWNYQPNLANGGTAPTAGTIYVSSLPLRTGQTVSNLVWQVQTAGASTVPTDIFCGLADSTGKMLTQSVTLKASAIWTPGAGSGIAQAPVTSFAVLSDGLYYGVFLQVGSWGTTQLALGKGTNNIAPGGVGTIVFGTAGTSQTALPANGSSLTIATTSGISYFVAAS